MKIDNCLMCCCHKDNKKQVKCSNNRHIFNISEKQAKKYNWSIEYIKSELKIGRHIIACLGSAGYTFTDDIEMLKNYSYCIGDKGFYNLLCQVKK
jgi:hypothetical protein